MNRKVKILFSVIVMIGLIFFFRSRISNYDKTICSEFRIEFPDSNSVSYVSADQLRNEVRAAYQPIEGAVVSEIDLSKINEVISSNRYVSEVHVFKSLDAVITAEVKLRSPVIRVFDANGNSYMVDRMGEVMPLPESQLFYLICVSGNVPELTPELYGKRIQNLQLTSLKGSEALNASWMIATVLQSDREFSELISQIYVESGDSIELIPAIGDFTINFGKPEQLAVKLEKLKILYTKIIPYVDMNQYTRVDITINNQFVFQKNMSYETERE